MSEEMANQKGYFEELLRSGKDLYCSGRKAEMLGLRIKRPGDLNKWLLVVNLARDLLIVFSPVIVTCQHIGGSEGEKTVGQGMKIYIVIAINLPILWQQVPSIVVKAKIYPLKFVM